MTGHTGFKGSWLSSWLSSMGARVTGYSLEPETEPSLYKVASVGEMVESVIADIRDTGKLCSALSSVQPEIVIHMAAQSLVRRSYREPYVTYSTNVLGTVNMFEAVRKTASVKVALVVTSDKCYENTERERGYTETDPMGGKDPYSASKGCQELVTASYRSSFFPPEKYEDHGVSVASARAGNVIGGGDWSEDRLIPDMIRAFAAGDAAFIRNPAAVRPWQHALEPLGGYMTLIQRMLDDPLAFNEGWNFGPVDDEDAKPVSQVADMVSRFWGEGAHWRSSGGDSTGEAKLLKLDCSKTRDRLGWTSRLSLDTALKWTVQWHKAYIKGENPLRVMNEQIEKYQELDR